MRVYPSLTLCVPVEEGGEGRYVCPVAAKVDAGRGVVFVRRQSDLARVDRGGRALSMLFNDDGRRLAHAWRGAWDRAEEGRPATILELALERNSREERENDLSLEDRMAAFREGTSRGHGAGRRAGGGKKGDDSEPSKSGESGATGTGDGTEPAPPRRELVSPTTLRLRDMKGQETERMKSRKPPRKIGGGGLVEPEGAVTPKTSTL